MWSDDHPPGTISDLMQWNDFDIEKINEVYYVVGHAKGYDISSSGSGDLTGTGKEK